MYVGMAMNVYKGKPALAFKQHLWCPEKQVRQPCILFSPSSVPPSHAPSLAPPLKEDGRGHPWQHPRQPLERLPSILPGGRKGQHDAYTLILGACVCCAALTAGGSKQQGEGSDASQGPNCGILRCSSFSCDRDMCVRVWWSQGW